MIFKRADLVPRSSKAPTPPRNSSITPALAGSLSYPLIGAAAGGLIGALQERNRKKEDRNYLLGGLGGAALGGLGGLGLQWLLAQRANPPTQPPVKPPVQPPAKPPVQPPTRPPFSPLPNNDPPWKNPWKNLPGTGIDPGIVRPPKGSQPLPWLKQLFLHRLDPEKYPRPKLPEPILLQAQSRGPAGSSLQKVGMQKRADVDWSKLWDEIKTKVNPILSDPRGYYTLGGMGLGALAGPLLEYRKPKEQRSFGTGMLSGAVLGGLTGFGGGLLHHSINSGAQSGPPPGGYDRLPFTQRMKQWLDYYVGGRGNSALIGAGAGAAAERANRFLQKRRLATGKPLGKEWFGLKDKIFGPEVRRVAHSTALKSLSDADRELIAKMLSAAELRELAHGASAGAARRRAAAAVAAHLRKYGLEANDVSQMLGQAKATLAHGNPSMELAAAIRAQARGSIKGSIPKARWQQALHESRFGGVRGWGRTARWAGAGGLGAYLLDPHVRTAIRTLAGAKK